MCEKTQAELLKEELFYSAQHASYVCDDSEIAVADDFCEGYKDFLNNCKTEREAAMETPLKFTEDEENYYCPGIGDDTLCLVALLMAVKFVLKQGITPKGGVLFVANSCEEGLGNLKGTRQLMKDYAGRVGRFYTVDGQYLHVVNRCVGSHRYLVECSTCGGHSFTHFGNPNAICYLARLIADLDTVTVPQKEGCKTTYNVGTVEGGTSVNTIAQNAKMLCEYRSDDRECLAYMKAAFEERLKDKEFAGKIIVVANF